MSPTSRDLVKRTTVINLFAGPGAGKSSFCAGIFATLKWMGVDCEMALEYAKDMVWQGSHTVLDNQLYVFGKQQNRLFRLNGKVDIVVTDSPLLNSIIYDSGKNERTRRAFTELVLSEAAGYDNHNFFIDRRKRYNPNGRLHSEASAKELDETIRNMLRANSMPYDNVIGSPQEVAVIVSTVLARRPDLKPVTPYELPAQFVQPVT